MQDHTNNPITSLLAMIIAVVGIAFMFGGWGGCLAILGFVVRPMLGLLQRLAAGAVVLTVLALVFFAVSHHMDSGGPDTLVPSSHDAPLPLNGAKAATSCTKRSVEEAEYGQRSRR